LVVVICLGVMKVFCQLVSSPLNSSMSDSGGQPRTAVSQKAGQVPFEVGA